jgi:large subunit ribosomal protein L24
MNKIRKNDAVYVLAGKDRGKSGRVFKVFPSEGRALVEGINYVKKHARKSQDNPQGGIIQRENPIHISNLALFCKTCNKRARVGFSTLADGTKSRFCKRCKEVIS